jgi:hypothetical protein
MSSLYDKRATTLLTQAAPTDSAAESAELDIANEPTVRLFVAYQAVGASKALRLYPEVRVTDLGWMPAFPAAVDTSTATIDAAGYLPATVAAVCLSVPGLDAVTVKATIDIPVPAGDRFRVRVLESGYDVAHPAQLEIYGAASRGAS